MPAKIDLASIRTRRTWLLEYDPAGREIARRELPRSQPPQPSPGMALLGLATPVTEAAALVGMHRYLRAQEAATGERWILLLYFDEWVSYMIPGIERGWAENRALEATFAALMFLSAAISGLVCFLLARRYAFSLGSLYRLGTRRRALRCGWCGADAVSRAVAGTGPLPSVRPPTPRGPRPMRTLRRPHALPAPDGTEIFETAAVPARANRRPVYQTAALNGEDRT